MVTKIIIEFQQTDDVPRSKVIAFPADVSQMKEMITVHKKENSFKIIYNKPNRAN